MSGYSPLKDALGRIAEDPEDDNDFRSTLRKSLALLYGGALLQMHRYYTAHGVTAPELSKAFRSVDMSRSANISEAEKEAEKCVARLRKACRELASSVEALSPGETSIEASSLAEFFGMEVYECLYEYLKADPRGLECPGNPFHLEFDGRHYSLIPSHTRGRDSRVEGAPVLGEVLRHRERENSCIKNGKVWAPHVHIIPWPDSKSMPKVQYLNHLSPQTDDILQTLPTEDGIRLAALSLDSDLVFEQETRTGNSESVKLVRVVAPSQWPEGWRERLRQQILQCSEKRIVLAVLPELSVSPEMKEVIREALRECGNGYPVLVTAGSWHYQDDSRSPGLLHQSYDAFWRGGPGYRYSSP